MKLFLNSDINYNNIIHYFTFTVLLTYYLLIVYNYYKLMSVFIMLYSLGALFFMPLQFLDKMMPAAS